jgi:hypothetical protein
MYKRKDDDEYFNYSVGELLSFLPNDFRDKNKNLHTLSIYTGELGTWEINYMRYEKWRGETQWGYRELFYDRMTKMWRFGGMNEYRFNSVHKLQHAIRFSGWNKDITL